MTSPATSEISVSTRALERGFLEMWKLTAILFGLGPLFLAQTCATQTVGNHLTVYDSRGILQPWTSWRDALGREVNWYLKCPWTNGYPRFVVMTFMDGNYNPNQNRPDCIPAMQNGMGIISYLQYHAWSGRKNPKLLEIARSMVNGTGNCGIAPGIHFQSSDSAFHRCI